MAAGGTNAFGKLTWILPLAGLALLAGAGFAAWSEVEFRRGAVETDGRVVALIEHREREDGRTTSTWTPVFTFALPDGKEIRAEGGVASNPPCCSVGDAIRVRYRPEAPPRAQMVGFMESWFVTVLLGGMGAAFLGAGVLARRAAGRWTQAAGGAMAGVRGMSLAVPLAGLRRTHTGQGPRWIVQARWTDPRSGVGGRLFESEPLPFDPVPQMRNMTTVQVQFDPSVADGPYAMDLSFLRPPAPDAAPVSAVRRG